MIEGDLVVWYLIVYDDKSTDESSEDHLLNMKGAMLETQGRFGIPKNSWKEL